MTLQILVLIFIVVMLGYIVFLHIQLAKKNIFIESTVRRLSGIEKSRSMEEMMTFLKEIQKLNQYGSLFDDKLLDDSTMNFIFENEKELKIYMHYTKDEADAKSILKNGFRYVESFYKTALPASADKLDLKIKHSSRKFFGQYLIIICISNDIVNYYSSEMIKAGIKNYSFENVLTEYPPSRNENSDQVFQLAVQYIKGYLNLGTGEIIINPVYDPWHNSTAFTHNIDLLKHNKS